MGTGVTGNDSGGYRETIAGAAGFFVIYANAAPIDLGSV
jgi:hypothetical protein